MSGLLGYTPYTGNLNGYGTGAEHSYFGSGYGLGRFGAAPAGAGGPGALPSQALSSFFGALPAGVRPMTADDLTKAVRQGLPGAGRMYATGLTYDGISGAPTSEGNGGGLGFGSIGPNQGLAEREGSTWGDFGNAIANAASVAAFGMPGAIGMGLGIANNSPSLGLFSGLGLFGDNSGSFGGAAPGEGFGGQHGDAGIGGGSSDWG